MKDILRKHDLARVASVELESIAKELHKHIEAVQLQIEDLRALCINSWRKG